LFREFTGPQWRSPAPQNRIKWRNYVDYGDPVGFELDTARDWMACRHYDENFDFTPADDFAFGRYYLPGKAHNDYWEDEEVFGHFIDGVVKSPPTAHRHGPKDKWGAQFCSYVVAYAIPLALVYAGVYLLYKMVGKYLEPASAPAHMAKNVALLGGLVAGTIVLWRMFVLTRSVKWRLIGVGVATATTLLFGISWKAPGKCDGSFHSPATAPAGRQGGCFCQRSGWRLLRCCKSLAGIIANPERAVPALKGVHSAL